MAQSLPNEMLYAICEELRLSMNADANAKTLQDNKLKMKTLASMTKVNKTLNKMARKSLWHTIDLEAVRPTKLNLLLRSVHSAPQNAGLIQRIRFGSNSTANANVSKRSHFLLCETAQDSTAQQQCWLLDHPDAKHAMLACMAPNVRHVAISPTASPTVFSNILLVMDQLVWQRSTSEGSAWRFNTQGSFLTPRPFLEDVNVRGLMDSKRRLDIPHGSLFAPAPGALHIGALNFDTAFDLHRLIMRMAYTIERIHFEKTVVGLNSLSQLLLDCDNLRALSLQSDFTMISDHRTFGDMLHLLGAQLVKLELMAPEPAQDGTTLGRLTNMTALRHLTVQYDALFVNPDLDGIPAATSANHAPRLVYTLPRGLETLRIMSAGVEDEHVDMLDSQVLELISCGHFPNLNDIHIERPGLCFTRKPKDKAWDISYMYPVCRMIKGC